MQVHCAFPSPAGLGHDIGVTEATEALAQQSRVAAALRTAPWRRSECTTRSTLENTLHRRHPSPQQVDMKPPTTAPVASTGHAACSTQPGETAVSSPMIRLQTQNAELCSLVRQQNVKLQELQREQLSTQSSEIHYLREMLAHARAPPPDRRGRNREANLSWGLYQQSSVHSQQHTPQPRHRGKPGGKKHVKKPHVK